MENLNESEVYAILAEAKERLATESDETLEGYIAGSLSPDRVPTLKQGLTEDMQKDLARQILEERMSQ